VLLGVVFLAAAYSKSLDPSPTAVALNQLVLSNKALVTPAVYTLALFEVALGSFLVAGAATRFAAVTALATLGCFTLYILHLIAFDIQINCGCSLAPDWFDGRQAQWFALLRNMLLISLAAIVWFGQSALSSHQHGAIARGSC